MTCIFLLSYSCHVFSTSYNGASYIGQRFQQHQLKQAKEQNLKVRTWLASRPRYHVHYTPTYASWLNQVERWFRRISQQAIRRGSFRSVKKLVAKIDHFVQRYNATAWPFVWTATADSILAKVQRLCEHISGTQH